MMEVRIASGIEVAMISVLRQLPRKIRIIKAVRQAAIRASRTTPLIAPRTKMDWSASGCIFSCAGTVVAIWGSMDLMPAITVNVEASPAFWMVSRTERWPFTRTILVCGGDPSRTQATSLM